MHREVLVHELDGHRSLADGRRATLRRARAHVPGGENPRNARLEQVGGSGGVAGEEEAVRVPGDGVAEPLGTWSRAEEEEEERERQSRAVGERDRLEVPVAAMELGNLAAIADRNAGALELLDQVVGHGLAQLGPAVQERDERAAPGQPD